MPDKKEERKLDETVPGGIYIVGDRVVNANGEIVPGYEIKNGEIVRIAEKPAKKE